MKTLRTHAIWAALLALPVAFAHTTGVSGVPKTYCESVTQDKTTHDYGPPATDLTLFGAADGSMGTCGLTGADGHFEFAHGGAYLLAGTAAEDCWSHPADHPSYPAVNVTDAALGAVAFSVWVDTEPAPCGDFQTEEGVSCAGNCTVAFPPGIDGAYHVFVQGTAGHVRTW